MRAMHPVTIAALESFPRALEQHYAAFPAAHVHWAPESWEGVPSEPFTAIEQICHVLDIEVEGYQVRFRRALSETSPFLPSIDSVAVARERDYGRADAREVFARLHAERAKTVAMLRGLAAADFERPAEFEGYGPVSLRGLVHYLCSHDQQHLSGLQWLLGKLDAARMGA
jgi:hypothetical protein